MYAPAIFQGCINAGLLYNTCDFDGDELVVIRLFAGFTA